MRNHFFSQELGSVQWIVKVVMQCGLNLTVIHLSPSFPQNIQYALILPCVNRRSWHSAMCSCGCVIHNVWLATDCLFQIDLTDSESAIEVLEKYTENGVLPPLESITLLSAVLEAQLNSSTEPSENFKRVRMFVFTALPYIHSYQVRVCDIS